MYCLEYKERESLIFMSISRKNRMDENVCGHAPLVLTRISLVVVPSLPVFYLLMPLPSLARAGERVTPLPQHCILSTFHK